LGPESPQEASVTTSRKLEEIAANLDDLSITLEEINDGVKSDGTQDTEKLDKVGTDMERAADAIQQVADAPAAER
jgi:methyl-accepting chemotaxis protein